MRVLIFLDGAIAGTQPQALFSYPCRDALLRLVLQYRVIYNTCRAGNETGRINRTTL
jgi:hypothetical protein